MTKVLSAKQKSEELGISMRALAKTRRLYKHIPKSPRKFLYFPEEPKEAVRPIMLGGSDSTVKSRSNRRRNVPFGQENYPIKDLDFPNDTKREDIILKFDNLNNR
jgi:hypothetical protein